VESLGLLFLGLIAFAAVVQGVFLVALGMGGARLLRRVNEVHAGLQAEIRPAFANMNRVAADMEEVTAVTAAQVAKVEDLVAQTVVRVEEMREHMAAAAARPLDSFREIGALLKGLRRGVQVYRQLGALGAQRRGATRRYAGDEHLFI
jgi:hypothetical protein